MQRHFNRTCKLLKFGVQRMDSGRIRVHYKQLSQFERGRIIGLKETDWNYADWGCFHLHPENHRRLVWRRPGQRADPAFTIARHTRVMVWGAISFEAGPFLVVIRGTLVAHQYVDYILRTILLLLLLQYSGLTFQQGNARLHMTRVAMNYLTACQTLP
ncbi:transposable element Tc1 transposase [Trichonephila clavipes]|nr:transposable element Tc1 transposase [Trichonephila clavipes]